MCGRCCSRPVTLCAGRPSSCNFVRVDGGRTFHFLAGSRLDVTSLHPHEPMVLTARQERRERVALREAALRPLASQDGAFGSALLEARRLELWAELRVGALRLRSGRVHRSLALALAAAAVPGGAGTGCYTQLVAGGQAAACVLSRRGTPWCWGEHPPGRRYSEGPLPAGPVVPLEGVAVEIAMAGAGLCVRTGEGAVYCTGPASNDQAETLDIGRVWRAPGLPPPRVPAAGTR